MIRFSSSSAQLRSSEIRDLMSLATRPDIISFAGGMPGNELFPIDEIDRIYNGLTLKEKQIAMQYGPTCGLPSILESLTEYLKKKGLPVNENKIILTTGSLQAINILGKLFIDPGDDVLVENPCFIGAISAFRSYQANMVPVPLNADGISTEILEEKILESKTAPKFLYFAPNFHNPAGTLYSPEVKQNLISLMQGKNIPLIEDDVYSDLYFHEEDLNKLIPIKGINPSGIDVCYTGSFSKILGPGLRLGWLLVPEEIYRKCELIKQSIDACSPSISQVIADKFIRNGEIYKYTAFAKEKYKERAFCMIDMLKKCMPDYVKWVDPRGGFYIWLDLPAGTDSTLILEKAISKGAVFVTGKTFDPLAQLNSKMRISFCNTAPDKIQEGIPIIAEAIREICG